MMNQQTVFSKPFFDVELHDCEEIIDYILDMECQQSPLPFDSAATCNPLQSSNMHRSASSVPNKMNERKVQIDRSSSDGNISKKSRLGKDGTKDFRTSGIIMSKSLMELQQKIVLRGPRTRIKRRMIKQHVKYV